MFSLGDSFVKRGRKFLLIMPLVLAVIVLVTVPLVYVPASVAGPGSCGYPPPGGSLCLTARYQSVTEHFFGFGVQTYDFKSYDFFW